MQIAAGSIDHYIIASYQSLGETFESLGFALRPEVRLSGAGEGLSNRIAYLRGGSYLELLCLEDPTRPAYGVADMLGHREGFVRLAVESADVHAESSRARALGWEVEGPFSHEADALVDSHRLYGRFEVIHVRRGSSPCLGAYFVNYVQRPDAGPWLDRPHPNGVIDVSRVLIVGSAAESASFGELVSPHHSGRHFEYLDEARWRALSGHAAEPVGCQPYLAGIVFNVRDLQATERWFADRRVPCVRRGRGPMVPSALAGGTALFFEQEPS